MACNTGGGAHRVCGPAGVVPNECRRERRHGKGPTNDVGPFAMPGVRASGIRSEQRRRAHRPGDPPPAFRP